MTKQVTSGTRLESGGIVKTVVGTVKAVDQGGIERVLQAGDKVLAGETIITSGGGSIAVDFAPGEVFYRASETQSGSGVEFINPQSDSGVEFSLQISEETLAMQDAIAAIRKSGSSMPWLEVVNFSDAKGKVTSGIDTEGVDDDNAFLRAGNIDFNMLRKLPPVNPVLPQNQAPVAQADSNWAKEDAVNASGNVLYDLAHNNAPSGAFTDAADTDADGDALTVATTGVFIGSYGTLVLNSNGTYVYTLDNSKAAVQALDTDDAPLTDTFNYVVTDGTSTSTATLTISIFGSNDAPVAKADSNWAREDTADASGNVLQTLAHGGAPSGTFGDVADTDVDVEPLTVVGFLGGNVYGTLTLNADGSYAYVLDNANAKVQALDDGEKLIDLYIYVVSDGAKLRPTILTITIFGTNDAPVAQADTNWAQEDVANASGNVLQNWTHNGAPDAALRGDVADADVDIETLTVTERTEGDAYGTLTLNPNGSYTYTLNNAHASVQALGVNETLTETYAYTVSDGTSTSTAALTITIFGTNDAPVAQADTNWVKDVLSGLTTTQGNVLQAIAHGGAPSGSFGDMVDTDVDGDTLTVTTTGFFIGSYGALVLKSDGSYIYILNSNNAAVNAKDEGDPPLTDTFNYTVTDGTLTDSHSLTITIFGTNDDPAAAADSNWAQEDKFSITSGNVLNDLVHDGSPIDDSNASTVEFADVADTGAGLTVTAFTGNIGHGTLTLNADGSYNYVLDHTNAAVQALDDGEKLTDSFTYRVTDGTASRTATLTITIFGTNDAPVANADTNWAKEDAANASGNVLHKLSHPGDPSSTLAFADVADTDVDVEPLTVTGHTGGDAYGMLTLNADGSYTYALDNAHAKVQALDDGQKLTETYIYTVSDGTATSAATLTITIFGTNDAPVAQADTNWVKDVISGAFPTANGNVLSNLAHGGAPSGTFADVADTDVDLEKLTVTTTGVFSGSYGALVLNSDGSYT